MPPKRGKIINTAELRHYDPDFNTSDSKWILFGQWHVQVNKKFFKQLKFLEENFLIIESSSCCGTHLLRISCTISTCWLYVVLFQSSSNILAGD